MALFPPLLVGNPQEFAPEAAVEAGGLSHQGPDMEVVQQRGLYGPWQCQVCREAAPGTRDMVLLGLFLAFSISARHIPSLTIVCCSLDNLNRKRKRGSVALAHHGPV